MALSQTICHCLLLSLFLTHISVYNVHHFSVFAHCREHNRSRNLIEPKETRERSYTDSDHESYMNSGV